jgi:hypothetical protein
MEFLHTAQIGTPQYPGKPRKGTPCNGCGWCCRSVRCYFSVELIGPGVGPCPALEYAHGRSWCGLLRNPMNWIDAQRLEGPWPTEVAEVVTELQSRLALGLAIGSGCDSEDFDFNTQGDAK